MSIYTENFETLFGKKQNIRTLHNKVLKLAIQGKLVVQDPNDEPASELVRSICEEKTQLVNGPKGKKDKLCPNTEEKEIPFEIPLSWTWARLSDVLDVRDGTHDTPRYVSEGIPLVTSKNLKNGKIDFSNVKYISELDHINIEKRSHVDSNDILFAMIGTIGNAVLVRKDNDFSIKNMALFKNYPNQKMNMPYVKIFLDAMEDELKEHASGGVQSFLSLKYIRESLIPIPPNCEQKRIVARVEALTSNVFKLDYCLERKEKLQEAIPKAVVSAITNCQNEEELKAEMAMIIEHFFDIFQTPQSLQELREMILQLGIQGRLLPQNSSDEPARKLLERIETDKKQLIQDKKIKKEKKMPEIEKEEEPFEIPNSWEWVRLGNVTSYGNNKTVAPGNIKDKDWILELEDIEKKSSKILKVSYNKERQSKSNKNRFSKGDVLYGKLRPYLKKVVVAPDDGLCTTEIIAFRGYCDISSTYLVNYFKTPFADNYINSVTYGMKMPRLGTKDAKLLLVPLPPIEEQRRIVAKTKTLMKLIEQMESKMSKKDRLVRTMATV